MQRLDLAGQRFGHLVVDCWDATAKRDGAWRCSCDCGNTHFATSSHLTNGRVSSCGCGRPPRHGGKGTPAYVIWQAMIGRCTRPANKKWSDYGGRGIRVCERWLAFPAFLEDMGQPPSGGTIERINNDGHYEPGNCRWASRKEQARNTRRSILIAYQGRTQPLVAWAEEFGISYWKLHGRYKLGWSPERMFSDVV